MAEKDKDRKSPDILDASAPRPEATPQAQPSERNLPRVLSDSEQRQADEYQQEAARQAQEAAEPGQRIDETQPGGKYDVNGRTVDAEGREV